MDLLADDLADEDNALSKVLSKKTPDSIAPSVTNSVDTDRLQNGIHTIEAIGVQSSSATYEKEDTEKVKEKRCCFTRRITKSLSSLTLFGATRSSPECKDTDQVRRQSISTSQLSEVVISLNLSGNV